MTLAPAASANAAPVVTLGTGTIAAGSTSSPTCLSGTIQVTVRAIGCVLTVDDLHAAAREA